MAGMANARSDDVALLLIRLALGASMAYHGSQNLFGIFGGSGFSQAVDASTMHPALASLMIFAQFIGGLGVLFGALTKVSGFVVGTFSAVQIAMAAASTREFVATASEQTFARFDAPFAAFAMASALLLLGGGAFSVDARFGRRSRA